MAEWKPGPPEVIQEKEFDAFRSECLKDDGWTVAVKDEKCTVWTKPSDKSPINMVRVRTQFKDVNPHTMYDIFHDHAYRKTWDENMIEGYVIQMLNKNNEVGYYSAKASVISNRDFVNIRAWKANHEKGEWLIVNHSVAHPDCPEKKGFVRAWSILSGYHIQRLEGDGTAEGGGSVFTYVSCADPRGWIPKWVINSFYSKLAPGLIDKMYNAAIGYKAWKGKQEDPNYKPWLETE
jgi:hypothetical protein